MTPVPPLGETGVYETEGTGNNAPVIDNSIDAQNVLCLTSWTFTVPTNTFSDPDGDSFTLSLKYEDSSTLPQGFTFVDGVISGTFLATYRG